MSPEEIRAQMERILASPLLAQSRRLSRFLRFVVQASTDGQSSGLKEYSIGVEVFDRGADFDPRIDNTVRIHAAKLRSKLTEYYAFAGAADPIVIGIPRGTYVPEIHPRKVSEPGQHPAANPARANTGVRIAVLPFVNMSSDPENEYFSDGLTEELINRLAGNPALQVVARTSAFQFKGQSEDLREVGVKLNVESVLEGSVRRAGDQVRVTAQLIDVQTGYHVFSRTYQREYKAIFELQDELAQAVAREIAPEQPSAAHKPAKTQNLDAYNAYLRGMFTLASRFTDLSRSVDHFQEAISLDPNYAPAWAGMSQGYFMLAWFYRSKPEVVMPLSRKAATKALSLDPDSAMGLHCLGVVECAADWNFASGEARFRRGIELQPSLAFGYVNYAYFCLLPQLRVEEACKLIEQALLLDPFNPLMQAVAIYTYGAANRYEDAVRQYELARNIAPTYAPIRASMGLAEDLCGHFEEAIETLKEACKLAHNAPYPFSSLGHALARAGRTEEAREVLHQLETSEICPAADIARVHSGLRDAEQTLRWLEFAADTRCLYLLRSTGDPRFDWLAGLPRFENVLRRMGLPIPALSRARS